MWAAMHVRRRQTGNQPNSHSSVQNFGGQRGGTRKRIVLRKNENLERTLEISQERHTIGGGRERKTNLRRFFVGWPVFRLNLRSQRKREFRSHATGCPLAFFTTHKRAPRARLLHAASARQSSHRPVNISQSTLADDMVVFSLTNHRSTSKLTRLVICIIIPFRGFLSIEHLFYYRFAIICWAMRRLPFPLKTSSTILKLN